MNSKDTDSKKIIDFKEKVLLFEKDLEKMISTIKRNNIKQK